MVASRTLAIIKPDGVVHPIIVHKIGKFILENNFEVTHACRIRLDHRQAEQLYAVHVGKFFYTRLVGHMTSGPCLAMQLQTTDGSDPISKWRAALGPSKLFANFLEHAHMPVDSKCLRQRFAVSDTRNCGHGSDSPAEVDREMQVFERFLKPVADPMDELFKLPKELQPTNDYEQPDAEFEDTPEVEAGGRSRATPTLN